MRHKIIFTMLSMLSICISCQKPDTEELPLIPVTITTAATAGSIKSDVGVSSLRTVTDTFVLNRIQAATTVVIRGNDYFGRSVDRIVSLTLDEGTRLVARNENVSLYPGEYTIITRNVNDCPATLSAYQCVVMDYNTDYDLTVPFDTKRAYAPIILEPITKGLFVYPPTNGEITRARLHLEWIPNGPGTNAWQGLEFTMNVQDGKAWIFVADGAIPDQMPAGHNIPSGTGTIKYNNNFANFGHIVRWRFSVEYTEDGVAKSKVVDIHDSKEFGQRNDIRIYRVQ